MSIPSGNPEIPMLTTEQMREVDRLMVGEYQILLIQMMENAGRNLAHLARRRFLNGNPIGRSILVLVGTGGNGGGGLVCARRLHNWGAQVQVISTAEPNRLTEIPLHQHSVLQRMGVPSSVAGDSGDLPAADLIVDAIIGYALSGAPTGRAATLIQAANAHGAPILALDAPSGVDTTTGRAYEPAIWATATMTLALPKKGLSSQEAKSRVGELYLADISVPGELYANPTLEIPVGPIFAEDDVIRVW